MTHLREQRGAHVRRERHDEAEALRREREVLGVDRLEPRGRVDRARAQHELAACRVARELDGPFES